MVGAINKRDILAHPIVTIRCFGWRVFLRALFARRDTTFLAVLAESEVLQPAADEVADFVARCVELELQASRIYTVLAKRFTGEPAVQDFFADLARQEESHAQLLELCRAAAARQRWDDGPVRPWQAVVPQLERRMREAAISVDDITSLRTALQLVIDIESSEINDVFSSVVSAADSDFVRGLRVFRETEQRHLDFICRGIARLDPELTRQSEILRKHCA
ncbi:MAG: hypothetical protein MUF48_03615 [Pirellulaceae bacterium]|jgi:hypothetical protein|nr:hypothetical protein [Pirellulaceae bacterium]